MEPSCYDEIHVENLEIFAHHGVFPEETRLGQKFLISLTLYVNSRPAGKSDCLEQSVHYGEVSSFVTDYMKQNTFKLIEAAAEHLAEELLLRYPLLRLLWSLLLQLCLLLPQSCFRSQSVLRLSVHLLKCLLILFFS